MSPWGKNPLVDNPSDALSTGWLRSLWLNVDRPIRVGGRSLCWKPIFYCLEERLERWLLNAAHMKAVPGRKSDVKDAEWIVQLLECGLLRPSSCRRDPHLRMLTRYRI